MITVDIKLLLDSLNSLCRKTLEEAALYCASRAHYEITVQHWLYALVQEERCDLALMLLSQDISLVDFKQAVLGSLEGMPTGNSAKPSISPQLFEWVQDAWLIGSIDLHAAKVRSAALLLALIKKHHFYNLAFGGDIFLHLNENHLTSLFFELTQASIEQDSSAEPVDPTKPAANGDDPLSLYCRDLSIAAAQDKIDPVFGRDQEIDQIIDVLARRRKNHPILVGFAGVGKTALVEGLALRIHQKSVPAFLKNSQLLSLDLAALEAGASVKGEFEKRLKALTDQIKQSKRPVILFADEAHMLIGAGNHGSGDAANLLKPMLARGELRMIAATTWEEYKKYIEKDPALVRRFQLVRVDEPSVAQTIQMLRGLKSVYERAHSVFIREEALATTVQLSSRYLSGRQQPDKSIDVLDTAAARVKLALTSVDSGWLLQQQVAATQAELTSLQQERQLTPSNPLAERIEKIEVQLQEQQSQLESHQRNWNEAAIVAKKILEQREHILAKQTTDVSELNTLLAQFKILKGSEFYHFEVNSDIVAQVVSDWSGVPLGKMLRNEQASLAALPGKLTARIKGQALAIQTICERVQAAKAGLTSSEQPLGVFLLVGPSGVGKTETALACADLLYGGKQNLITINMSEFQEKHSVSRLIGSPPGYVGYGEGGVLSEAVRQKPYSVVLLDEIEKAAPDIMNLFYQVFDKGQLNDGEGVEIDFKNTLIFMTSNLASDLIMDLTKQQTVPLDTIRNAIMPSLNQFIMPSLLARMTIVPYHALALEALIDVSQQKCQQLAKRLFEQRRIELRVTAAVHQAIAERCQTWGGARQIDFILQQEVFPILTQRCLAHESSDISLVLQIDRDEQDHWQLTEVSQ